MLKEMKYLAWNGMLIGGLVLASIFDIGVIISILGIFYGFEAAVYFFSVFMYSADSAGFFKRSDKMQKNLIDWKIYRYVFEVIFIVIAFYLNHPYIGTCMIITLFGFTYLKVSAKEYADDIANKGEQ